MHVKCKKYLSGSSMINEFYVSAYKAYHFILICYIPRSCTALLTLCITDIFCNEQLLHSVSLLKFCKYIRIVVSNQQNSFVYSLIYLTFLYLKNTYKAFSGPLNSEKQKEL